MIGSRIKEIRIKEGLSQQEFGNVFKLSQSTIASYESEDREPPLKFIIQLCRKYHISSDYLLNLVDNNQFVLGKKIIGGYQELESEYIDTIKSIVESKSKEDLLKEDILEEILESGNKINEYLERKYIEVE